MPKKLKYSIQKHAATRLHYDLRLEMDGTLKSWAIPKGPSTKSHEKRLAMQTPNHPISYYNFEGSIPQGSYGAGTVELFDVGTYELISGTEKEIIIQVHGKKLKGTYCLIRFRTAGEKAWLFFKKA